MASDLLEEQVTPTAASDWRLWCRLCAKDDVQGNMNVFLKNENSGDGPSGDLSLATAIGKYFWVNVSQNPHLTSIREIIGLNPFNFRFPAARICRK